MKPAYIHLNIPGVSAVLSRLSNGRFATVIETIAVVTCAIAAIKYLDTAGPGGLNWLLIPAILMAAAIFTAILFCRKFNELGLRLNNPAASMHLLFAVCLIVFPFTFVAMWLAGVFHIAILPKPTPLEGHNLISWILYQFMYVAVAEELFFRGYVQTNISKILKSMGKNTDLKYSWQAIIIAAIIFAAAHFVVTGQPAALLTFAPGIVLGWLFARTGSLLAPVLFHAMANVFYYFALTSLT